MRPNLHVEPSAYRAAAVAMRLLLDGGDPFPGQGAVTAQGRNTLTFQRTGAVDETVMSWKTSELNAYATLCSAMAACLRGDNSQLARFVSDQAMIDGLARLDDALRNAKMESGE
jgi:hypothetical protein